METTLLIEVEQQKRPPLEGLRARREKLYRELEAAEYPRKMLDPVVLGCVGAWRDNYRWREWCPECGEYTGPVKWERAELQEFHDVCLEIVRQEREAYAQALAGGRMVHG